MRDARHAIQNFQYKPIILNPFNTSIRQGNKPPAKPGVMTYLRAHHIIKEWYKLSPTFLKPYFTMQQRYGTTLPEKLKAKGFAVM